VRPQIKAAYGKKRHELGEDARGRITQLQAQAETMKSRTSGEWGWELVALG
jgi:hypothetical protein